MDVIINGVKYVPALDIPTDLGLLTALELRLNSRAGNNLTIREYLRNLLSELWERGESFSSKRPFGDSGWEYDLFIPLVEAGLISGELDDNGSIYTDGFNRTEASEYVAKLIIAAFHGVADVE